MSNLKDKWTNSNDPRIGNMENLSTTNKSTLVEAINEVKNFASDLKAKVAEAITGKGISASATDTAEQLATKIGQIQTAKGTAIASDVLSGKTFSNSSGTEISGTMTNRGAVTNTLSTDMSSYTIPAGYHNGSGKVTANITNLLPANIVKGKVVGGVTGTTLAFPSTGVTGTWSSDTRITTNTYSITLLGKPIAYRIRFSCGSSYGYDDKYVMCGGGYTYEDFSTIGGLYINSNVNSEPYNDKSHDNYLKNKNCYPPNITISGSTMKFAWPKGGWFAFNWALLDYYYI